MSDYEQVQIDNLLHALRENVVGERIAKIENSPEGHFMQLTLSNGKMLTITSTADCCANSALRAITEQINSENVITDVSIVETPEKKNPEAWWGEAGVKFSIFLLSAFKDEAVQMEGMIDESNGYYSFGWHIEIDSIS